MAKCVFCCCSFFMFLSLSMSSLNWMTNAQLDEYPPIANLSSSWINSASTFIINNTTERMRLNPILLRGSSGPRFVCGFYCYYNNTACLFAVLIFQNRPQSNTTSKIEFARLVWSTNPNMPVKIGATLNLTQDGDLILSDGDGTPVWSTGTEGGSSSVSGLNLTEMGNLVLFDTNNTPVWQSFDHPTDSLVPGQMLVSGQKLTSSISSTDWRRGKYSLALNGHDLVVYIDSNPPQFYYKSQGNFSVTKTGQTYFQYLNGSLGEFKFPSTSAAQFLRLEPDGHLKVFEWGEFDWREMADLLTPLIGECGYPMVCGKYGVCSKGVQCSCPDAASSQKTYFRQNSYRQPNLGCNITTPVSCRHSQHHTLFELPDTDYFGFAAVQYSDESDLENCKNMCLMNCSCKAAVFRHHSDSQKGNCSLLPEVFSLLGKEPEETLASAFIKVQNSPKKRRGHVVIMGSIAGALVGMVLIIGTWVFLFRKKNISKEVEEDYLDQLPGMATRFSYENLKTMTKNFNRKLGEGGFGSVYEGVLSNGTKIAVKHLDGIGLVKKSFLAEVETIGSIHHVNLVRLIGFCAEKSYRLLVYEFMSNSSLNKWIFPRNRVVSLRWQCRRKIIFDIAKGLAYLHEECRQKIFHLDIKPQNILLDENFNAKVADFGVSKLIDKDQSQVVTTLRGTPGYMAPEWLSSSITEKVDVYSFGVVVLEILCGRKNLDRSQPEEEMHLLSLFKRKTEEKQLTYIVDKYSENMQLHREEVVEMMRLAAWCLQSDFTTRPSMSVVVKVLEGLVDVEGNLDYNFMILPVRGTEAAVHHKIDTIRASTPLLPSTLSGPR